MKQSQKKKDATAEKKDELKTVGEEKEGCIAFK